jgi:hypothetical protein
MPVRLPSLHRLASELKSDEPDGGCTRFRRPLGAIRQILGIFMRHRIQASGILQHNDFFDVRDGDFQRGLNKAVANNWVTIDLRNRYRYHLTAQGYAAGLMIDH